MAEYVYHLNTGIQKIGVCEELFYISFEKYLQALNKNLLSHSNLPGTADPAYYASPQNEFYFRFPHPKDDHLSFCEVADNATGGELIEIPKEDFTGWLFPNYILEKQSHELYNFQYDLAVTNPNNIGDIIRIEIVYQKNTGKYLNTVIRCPFCRKLWALDEDSATILVEAIKKNYLSGRHDAKKVEYYNKIASRILMGYNMPYPI